MECGTKLATSASEFEKVLHEALVEANEKILIYIMELGFCVIGDEFVLSKNDLKNFKKPYSLEKKLVIFHDGFYGDECNPCIQYTIRFIGIDKKIFKLFLRQDGSVFSDKKHENLVYHLDFDSSPEKIVKLAYESVFSRKFKTIDNL